ncbi:hypothetical protein KNV66_gp02 [Bacillus phage DLc1]|uniref:Uncharacterized protein n=1 Tax=Bacillus phage DLc1 TaxID=2777318 RepID=A0A7M1RQW5_9CAUD|nr:hypothetical protein KNV66_gp02 [Bacillus phage DLc1]QOR56301.1 hypothetical protein [Bacillus phage DLc1]
MKTLEKLKYRTTQLEKLQSFYVRGLISIYDLEKLSNKIYNI